MLTDITELTRTIQVKADFVANASHELRTPLAAIRAAIETLLTIDPAAEAESARHLLEVIDRHGARLEAMVNDLLDLSRLESPAARFERAVLHVEEVMSELHQKFAEALQAKNLHWRAQCPADRPTIIANRQLLRLVLDNLVDNAVKFTGDAGHVSMIWSIGDHEASVVVEDDGCGIPPGECDRVFERFYQVERSRAGPKRGTGLGLAIVRHAVHAMEGEIRLESALGCGTRLTVTIPQRGHGLAAAHAAGQGAESKVII